jgi:hypothetical protein
MTFFEVFVKAWLAASETSCVSRDGGGPVDQWCGKRSIVGDSESSVWWYINVKNTRCSYGSDKF